MKKIHIILVSALAFSAVIVLCAFEYSTPFSTDKLSSVIPSVEKKQEQQSVNLFVTHGHCSSPFSGKVDNLEVNTKIRYDAGNPLENMQISFDIDPETFVTCRPEYDQITSSVQTPGLFSSDKHEMISFQSTSVYTMGMDWYQVNGKLSIKGVESDVKFFASGIRNSKETMTSKLILEGQIDLTDWGIDYDLIVNGKSHDHPTKWMHINMKIDLPIDDC